MFEYDYLSGFRASDGSTTSAGQANAGIFEKQNNYTPAPQQSWESASAYGQRLTGGQNWSSGNGNS